MMLKLTFLSAFLIAILSISLSAKEPGEKADDFTLMASDGKSYNLVSEVNAGKTVVVIFWSTKCPFVQAYNERAVELYSQYKDKNVTIWPVNSNSTESMEEIQAHATQNGYQFPVLKDADNKIADMFGALRTPEVFVIGKDNLILYHGRIDDSKDPKEVQTYDLKNALNEIIAGKEVSVKTTKSFGCTIKKAGQDN